ncbi:MAG TPA: hypothetical protein PLW65_10610, partial [Pseudomonadota bacterium]|nr:hypothetical protein [Pseudomonadota bacterium]
MRRSIALLGVLWLAKAVILLLRGLDGNKGVFASPLAVPALLAADLGAALGWAGLEALTEWWLRGRGERLRWALYYAVAVY